MRFFLFVVSVSIYFASSDVWPFNHIRSRLSVARSISDEVYENNGGTVFALAGKEYAVIATDTRLSKGMTIMSRGCERLWELSPGIWLGMGGCLADMRALAQSIQSTCEEFYFEQGHHPGIDSVAQLLSTVLYSRRQMPYYAFCVLAGLDQSSRTGTIFTFDAVGNFERVESACVGGSQLIALPILDQYLAKGQRKIPGDIDEGKNNTVRQPVAQEHFQHWSTGGESPAAARPPRVCDLNISAAVDCLKTVAKAASIRDIRLGDGLDIVTISLGSSSDHQGTVCSTRHEPRFNLAID